MHKHKEDALNCGDTTPILVSLAPSRRLPDLSVERRSELSVVSPEFPGCQPRTIPEDGHAL